MTIRARLPTSLRGRFLLVVIVSAVVPLALIGVWLTRSVVVAGEDLLRSELSQSLDRIVAPVGERWSYRQGDLGLLANNDAAGRLLAASPTESLPPADAGYFSQLAISVSPSIVAFEYRDAAGRVRWSSPTSPAEAIGTPGLSVGPEARGAGASNPVAVPAGPTMTVRRAIAAPAGGSSIGELVAQVSLATLVPIDASIRLPNGARLQLVERSTGLALLPIFSNVSIRDVDRLVAGESEWLVVHRSLQDPAVDLALAAPIDAYVQPFRRVARAGAITLALVSLLALGLSAFLTRRATSSLEQLAVAADTVAGGDLDHRIGVRPGRDADEIQRVGAAFNSMTESLRRTLAELSKRQALAAAGEFAVSLSHEVRNGLTAVRVDLQRAQEKTGADAPSRPLLARALENVKRLDGTITGSLRAARRGGKPKRRLDLGLVVSAAAQNAESTFLERGATLTPASSSGPPAWILGDPLALEELVLNLLLNSAQAMGAGGRASVTVDVDRSDVRIVVTDSGAGIAPGDLEHVFDPFFSTKPDGAGLGLPIARQIAAAHGGSLIIASAPGDGTRVEVRLPLVSAPS